MHALESHDVRLPPQAVANVEYPYEGKVELARRFLAERGITEVRALYDGNWRIVSSLRMRAGDPMGTCRA